MIVPIDQWVLQTALAQLAVWQTHSPDLTMAVNLSGEHFLHDELVTHVAATLQQTGAVASNVALEITETILMRDVEDTLVVLHQLRQLGVQLHVDDFGTGFSSLSYLKRFPVDALKVDRSFVSGLGVEAEDRAIVQAVVALADALGLETIAEGVEDADQCAALEEIGCSAAQGYLFSRPLAADDFTALLPGVRARVPAPRSTPVTIQT